MYWRVAPGQSGEERMEEQCLIRLLLSWEYRRSPHQHNHSLILHNINMSAPGKPQMEKFQRIVMNALVHNRTQGTGYKVQDTGRRTQGTRYRTQDTDVGHRVQGTGHRVQDVGHRVQGTGHRVQGTGRRTQGTGHRTQGTGHRT